MSARNTLPALATALLGLLLAAVDQTIVATAAPQVTASFHELEHYAWVSVGYLLTSTVTIPIYGKLSDLHGRRPLFITGMSIFLLGSALCGQAQDMLQLVGFRLLQGVGAGAITPIAQAIIGDTFPPAQRGKWQGLLMAVVGLATLAGPVVGGWLTDAWGWRSVFYINLPIGGLAIATALCGLRPKNSSVQSRVDYLGAAVLVGALTPLLLALSWGGTARAWSSPEILALFAGSAAMLALFLQVERRAVEPIVTLTLLRNRTITLALVATFLQTAILYGAILYLPLLLQRVEAQTAMTSGTSLAPMVLAMLVTSITGGQIIARSGRYKLVALVGFALTAVGLLLLALLPSGVGGELVVRYGALTGVGIGATLSVFTVVIQNAVPHSALGEAMAALQFFRSVGGTVGVAVLGSLMANRIQSTDIAALEHAMREMFLAATVIAAGAFMATSFLRELPLRPRNAW